MDFEKLVSPLTDYLSFAIGFWTNDLSAFDEYLGASEVSAKALLLSLIGIGVGLLLRYMKTGIVPTDAVNPAPSGPKIDANTLVFVTFTGLATPLCLEAAFWILNTREHFSLPPEATFNASFLAFALIAPISALGNRLNSIHGELEKVGGKVAKFSKFLNFAISLIFLYLVLNCFSVFSIVLGIPLRQLWLPLIVAFALFLCALLPYIFFLFFWNKYILEKTNKPQGT